ncbi:fucose-specific lectin [Microthyrium microscopicum]|uniref:Fucose-specific lectin n=1 Tax=Microthyrium microscopicum TaxID=703497 RepID=A0A6A6TV56_9PEZI|nr:fucose-specific lectin [Microthyrium microscopicum]
MSPNHWDTGYIPDTFDPRDLPYYFRGTDLDLQNFNGIHNHVILYEKYPSFFEPIYDQANTKSSVANAVAAAVRFLAWKTGQTDEALLDPSRLFIYYNARAILALKKLHALKAFAPTWPCEVEDTGCCIRDALKSLKMFGSASEAAWPWVENMGLKPGSPVAGNSLQSFTVGLNDCPLDRAYAEGEAITQTIKFEYCRLDPDHHPAISSALNDTDKWTIGSLTLNRLKQCLVEGYPVIFALSNYFDHPWESDDVSRSRELEGKPPWLKKLLGDDQGPPVDSSGRAIALSSHAVLAVGFNDETKGVLVQNSRGNLNCSHFWIPYDYIISYWASSDFWTIRPTNSMLQRDPAWATLRTKHTSFTSPSGWTTLFRDIDGKVASVATNTTCPVICRTTNRSDIFWITSNGSVEGVYNNGDIWCRYQGEGPGNAAEGAIAAISRTPTKMEVFWIGPRGSVEGMYLQEQGWKCCRFSDEGTVERGSGITALSRDNDLSEFWYVRTDGGIQGVFWDKSSGKGKWENYELAGGHSTTKQSALAACSWDENHMAVFWIAMDGSIMFREYNSLNQGWMASSPTRIGQASCAALQSRVTVVTRSPGNYELFFISPAGVVQHWSKNSDTKWEGRQLDKERLARVDSDIKAISTANDRLQVLWVGNNNSLVLSNVHEYRPLEPKLHPLLAQPGQVKPGSPLALFCRKTDADDDLHVSFTTHEGIMVIMKKSNE